MKRYLLAFFFTTIIYIVVVLLYFFYFEEQKPLKLNEEKRIAMNHISLIQQKEVIHKHKSLKKIKKGDEPIKKLKKVMTTSQDVKRTARKAEENFLKKEAVLQQEVTTKKEFKETQPKLIKTAIKRDYKEEFIDKHLHQIVKLIQRNIIYPKRARQLHIQGEVLIEFMVTKEGKAIEYKMIKGHRLLQKSTIKAIQKAAPFFPKVKRSLKLVVPVQYVLT